MSIVIVHVSDIHLGASFLPAHGSRNGGTGTRHIPGLEPHDVVTCQYLCNRLKREEPIWRASRALRLLAVSGDLTVKGQDGEFSQALTFLHGEVATSWMERVGLGPFGFREVLAVPGNHDHWGGGWLTQWFLRGVQHRLHGTFFPTGPGKSWWFREYEDPDGEFLLQIMGLDSSAGSQMHVLAKGSVDRGDVDALKQQITASNQLNASKHAGKRIARILMIHHGSLMPGLWNAVTHSLDPASVQLVDDLRQHGVHRVLTGHIHTPHCSDFELRAGTTLQQSAKGGQSFLTHTLTWDGAIGIETRQYQRSPGGPFRLVHTQPGTV